MRVAAVDAALPSAHRTVAPATIRRVRTTTWHAAMAVEPPAGRARPAVVVVAPHFAHLRVAPATTRGAKAIICSAEATATTMATDAAPLISLWSCLACRSNWYTFQGKGNVLCAAPLLAANLQGKRRAHGTSAAPFNADLVMHDAPWMTDKPPN